MMSAIDEVREGYLRERRYALEELVQTEKAYVRDLEQVVEGYVRTIRSGSIDVPDDLRRGKIKFVFGNIEQIFYWHRDYFRAQLAKCLDEPEQLGIIFQNGERRLHMYVAYCQNKPYSEYVVSEYGNTFFKEIRRRLGHSLRLSDLLIKPIQRIMMYKLLLSRIFKISQKAGVTTSDISRIEKAVQLMENLPKLTNEMMSLGSLQGFEGEINEQGKLLHQGQLLVCQLRGGSAAHVLPTRAHFKQRRVFLFEKMIIFCEMVAAKGQFASPSFVFKRGLPVNKTKLHQIGANALEFVLTTQSASAEPGLTFVVRTQSAQNLNEWLHSIEAVLNQQQDFLRALESPIAYQKKAIEDDASRISLPANHSENSTSANVSDIYSSQLCSQNNLKPPKAKKQTENNRFSSLEKKLYQPDNYGNTSTSSSASASSASASSASASSASASSASASSASASSSYSSLSASSSSSSSYSSSSASSSYSSSSEASWCQKKSLILDYQNILRPLRRMVKDQCDPKL